MTNWIKSHALSMVYTKNDMNREELVESQQRLWKNTPEVGTDAVNTEINRLFETGQIVEENGYVKMGTPIFEEAVEVSPKAHIAAQTILENLKDRRGVGNEIESMDDDVIDEMINTIAAIIDKQFN